MKVRVLYFAAVRELVGVDEEALELPAEIADVGALRGWLGARHRGLAERMGHVRVARNEVFVEDAERLAPDDTIALIPPVAGG